MLRPSLFRWVIVSVSCASLLAPSPSYAFCCNWFKKQCAAPALACNPCGVQQTVSYVPQTCYRTQYCTVPVTTCRPAVMLDPCSGCPVTTMRPVIAYVQKAQLVPYTTYRLVYSNACATCAPAVATAAYAPSPMYAPAATYAPAAAAGGCSSCSGYAPAMRAGGCGSCGMGAASYAAPALSTPMYAAPSYATPSGSPMYSAPGGAMPTYGQPSVPTYSQPGMPATTPMYSAPGSSVPTYGQPAVPSYSQPGTPSVGPATSTPSLSPTPGGPSTSTPSNSLKPIPDPNVSGGSRVSPSSSPRLIDPESRTTSIPVYRPWAYDTVSWPNDTSIRPASATHEQPLPVARPARRLVAEDDGWRPSNR